MREIYYVYNNEAIASCVFLSVLNRGGAVDIARSCLILPLLLDDRTINYLKRNQDAGLSLGQLIEDRPRLFTSFNKRYLSLLPVAINSFMLLSKSGQIKIENQISTTGSLNFENHELGLRFNKIDEMIPMFLTITEMYSTTELYKILKVQL